jgi:SAM-dependent methyltransferase
MTMSISTILTQCISCSTTSVKLLLDFDQQPPSNRFLRESDLQSQAHCLALGQCAACGLVQLVNPMSEDMVRSHHAWISYNEPEGHLDQMVDDLIRMTDLKSDARIVGLSYKDDTTLARFNRRGFANTYRYNMDQDLGISDPLAGLETIQRATTAERADALVKKHGQADLLLVRHLLEHAHAPKRFFDALGRLTKPTGSMVFEMPDSKKFLAACDYSFVWEEHITYFTIETLRRFIKHARFDPWSLMTYEYPLEDSLVAVVRPVSPGKNADEPAAAEIALGDHYAKHFAEARERMRADLSRLKNEGMRVAVFGAGHLAAKFLNLFDLQDLVYCVIDDNPHKLGLRMPGSGVLVRPSSVLIDEKIDVCLLSLNPESEKKVIAGKQAYVDQGGQFRSIFTLSSIAYQAVLA